MATYTPNLNLYKPDSTDDYETFRAEFNNNMEKIDQSGGGGGGGGSAKVIKNQTLTFVNLVATVMDSDITVDSDFIIYYYDEAEAESANITAVASAGTITFTAETAPINPIVCDVVLLDVSGGGGGSGTVNYSTTEQVIGTWIDGKPLYQITAELGAELTVNSGTWTNTPISNADKKAIINVIGTSGTGTCWNMLSGNCDTGAYVQAYHTRGSAITLKYLTIQYTKTTD